MKAGITGHQSFENPTAVEWIKTILYKELSSLLISRSFSCLAKGSDQIFASVSIELKIPLTAIIPCKNYNKTFNEADLIQYRLLLDTSETKVQLDFQEPSEQAFYEAGKYVANHSDILFAIWNGKPAKGLGGTADIVNYALQQNKKIIHLNPVTMTVKVIRE